MNRKNSEGNINNKNKLEHVSVSN